MCDSQSAQLSNGPSSRVEVRYSASDEFTVHFVRGFGEHCHLGSDTAMKQIGGFQNTRLASVDRDDNDVGGSHRIGHDQEASGRSQDGRPERERQQKNEARTDSG